MTLSTTTHLNFRGTAREALEFYRDVLGGELITAAYADHGMPADAPGADGLVFGRLETAEGLRLMAYDVPGTHDETAPHEAGWTRREHGLTITDRPFFQSLRGTALDEVEPVWRALCEGAEIIEPLAASAWSPGFGMLTDRFGVTWVIDVAPA